MKHDIVNNSLHPYISFKPRPSEIDNFGWSSLFSTPRNRGTFDYTFWVTYQQGCQTINTPIRGSFRF